MGRRSTGTVEPLKNSIRLKFTYEGQRRVETLEDMPPTPNNVRAAERLMARIQSAIAAGVYRRGDFFAGGGVRTNEAFGDYADEWLKTLTVAKSTRRSYTTAMRATWKPAFAGKLLREIRFSDVKAAVAAKSETVSGKTVNNQLIPLRDLFDTALKDGLIDRDPTAGIKNLAHQKPQPDPFDADEMAAILAHMQDRYSEQIWNYYTFAFHTGLRPSEQIALTWGDVDWRRRTVKVQRALVDGEIKSTKTNLERDVDLSDDALAALTRQKVHTFMKTPDGPIFHDPLHNAPFPNERAPRRRFFKPTLRAAGIRERDAYNTRHTFATLLLMGGANPAYIARQLGHANTGMLFKHYSKWIDGADKGIEAAKLNAILSPGAPSAPSEGAK